MKTIELNEAKRLVAEGMAMSHEERMKVQQEGLPELLATTLNVCLPPSVASDSLNK